MPWTGLTARNQSAQALTRCAFFVPALFSMAGARGLFGAPPL